MSAKSLVRMAVIAAVLMITAVEAGLGAAVAADAKSYRKQGKFDDIRFELTEAIIGKGLVIDFNGKVGEMLARTGADVGSSKPIYTRAEYLTFCSAKLSRAMMEADPANAAYCPYVMYIYELASKPGEVIVGYRMLPSGQTPGSRKALAEINALLDGLAKAAVK
jgi:uncharacterized protein (DUF302 family)